VDQEITSKDTAIEYQRPEVFDYGDLAEVTQTHTTSGYTDVPKGTLGGPGSPIFSVSP
jgi:hypothetical protein